MMITTNSLTLLYFMLSTSLLVVNSLPRYPEIEFPGYPRPPLPGGQLMMGKSKGFFDTPQAALNAVDFDSDVDLDFAKGKKVAEDGSDFMAPEAGLEMGNLVKGFSEFPSQKDMYGLVGKQGARQIMRDGIKKGNMLSEDVKSGSYVPNPAKVLGEILADGGEMPAVLDGEILAGDAAEVDVLTNLNQ